MVQLLCPKSLWIFVNYHLTKVEGRWRLITIKIRKHSSRMYAGHLPTVRASVATRCQYWWRGGVGSSTEEFWTGLQWWVPDDTSRGARARGPMSDVWLYNEGQCIVANVYVGPTINRLTDWCTDTTENITFPKLRWQAVNIIFVVRSINYVSPVSQACQNIKFAICCFVVRYVGSHKYSNACCSQHLLRTW